MLQFASHTVLQDSLFLITSIWGRSVGCSSFFFGVWGGMFVLPTALPHMNGKFSLDTTQNMMKEAQFNSNIISSYFCYNTRTEIERTCLWWRWLVETSVNFEGYLKLTLRKNLWISPNIMPETGKTEQNNPLLFLFLHNAGPVIPPNSE